jgi:hypothetical protein
MMSAGIKEVQFPHLVSRPNLTHRTHDYLVSGVSKQGIYLFSSSTKRSKSVPRIAMYWGKEHTQLS